DGPVLALLRDRAVRRRRLVGRVVRRVLLAARCSEQRSDAEGAHDDANVHETSSVRGRRGPLQRLQRYRIPTSKTAQNERVSWSGTFPSLVFGMTTGEYQAALPGDRAEAASGFTDAPVTACAAPS